jgi:predicted DNA-binding transcriptional regulator YafY
LANSKHAHLRYNYIDYCLKHKAFTFKQLLEYINNKITELYPGESISIRTLRDDIKLFRDSVDGFGAPLAEGIRILQYSEPNFSIAKKPLLPYENYLLEASQQLLERFENHPKYNRLSEALIKFQDDENDDTDNSKILFYDQNEEYKGIKHLKPLYLAIKKKQVLEITYKGFNDNSDKTFEFHPYVLKQYNRRWFVFGLNSYNGNNEWSIPLDERLIDFTILENKNYLVTEKKWETFFRTMVGVVRPKDSETKKVVLRFHNKRENYFKTKPFHPDYDEFFEKDKQDQVYFETIINKELVQQILSFGQDVEVLEPEELKIALKNQVKTMHKLYTK